MTPGTMVMTYRKVGYGRTAVPAKVIRLVGGRVLIQPARHGHTEWVAVGLCKPWKKGNFLVNGGKA